MTYKYQVGELLQVTPTKRGYVVQQIESLKHEPMYIVEDEYNQQSAVLERKVYWKVRV